MSERIEDFLNAEPHDREGATWREWIILILVNLEDQAEGFSGKRPFGNSGWWLNLAEGLTLVDPKIGTPKYDEHGFLDEFDPDRSRVSDAWRAVLDHVMGAEKLRKIGGGDA